MPVWIEEQSEIVVHYDEARQGDLVKISSEHRKNPYLSHMTNVTGVLTRPDPDFKCWYAVFRCVS